MVLNLFKILARQIGHGEKNNGIAPRNTSIIVWGTQVESELSNHKMHKNVTKSQFVFLHRLNFTNRGKRIGTWVSKIEPLLVDSLVLFRDWTNGDRIDLHSLRFPDPWGGPKSQSWDLPWPWCEQRSPLFLRKTEFCKTRSSNWSVVLEAWVGWALKKYPD